MHFGTRATEIHRNLCDCCYTNCYAISNWTSVKCCGGSRGSPCNLPINGDLGSPFSRESPRFSFCQWIPVHFLLPNCMKCNWASISHCACLLKWQLRICIVRENLYKINEVPMNLVERLPQLKLLKFFN